MGIYSCAKESNIQNAEVIDQNVETRAGDWKFAYTWKGLGKDCVAPPKDCKAFKRGGGTSDESPIIQSTLDGDLSNTGTQSFFLSSNASVLFPGLDVEILSKLQSGLYRMHKFTNTNGDDFYFAGKEIVNQENFEFVLKLDN